MTRLAIRPLAVFLFAALLLSPFALPRAADAGETGAVIEKLQRNYGRIRTIEASFTQVFRSAAMGTEQTSTGKVYLKKPGKMRWDYREPVKDEIVSNGKTVWVYQPDLNQVISRPADAAASGIATDFLSGIGDLEKDFDIRLAAQDTETWTLELTPRTPQPNLKKLLMDVDKKSMLAVKTRVFDHFGNETQVSFNDIKINNALTDLMFEFIPPEGASVIRP